MLMAFFIVIVLVFVLFVLSDEEVYIKYDFYPIAIAYYNKMSMNNGLRRKRRRSRGNRGAVS